MERLEKILQLVSQHGKIEVNQLSDELAVSKVTIRKDLDKLEAKGLLRREHGFAVLNSGDDLNVRLSFHYPIKKKIAQVAANLVEDGQTLMIESGSTCALLAEELCQTKKNITLITNSYFIANFVRDYDNCKVILLGGEFQSAAQVTVGPLLHKMIQHFHVEKAFIGLDGFDRQFGFMGKDLMRSEVVQKMAEVADQVVILTDSSKFYRKGTVIHLEMHEISTVITDSGIPETIMKQLESNKIDLTLVDSENK